jgi:hypothetical protein
MAQLARYAGVSDSGQALVAIDGGPAVAAPSLADLAGVAPGAELAVLFLDADRGRPLILGAVRPPVAVAEVDGERVVIEGREQITLRCGKASIVMKKDGHITIRGTYLVSHASAANRIRGGSVNLN